jgi:hypothetical protein
MATGLSISSTSNLSTGQKQLIANAMEAFEPEAATPDLVGSTRIPQGAQSWAIGTYARLSTANALTEGTDLAQSEQLVANYLTITPSEHGIIATVSNRLIRRQGDADVMALVGRQMGASLRRRMDLDVIALFSGFSKSSPGASLTLDITHFRGVVAYLMTDNDSSYGPAPMPIHGSLHIEQISDILMDLTDTTPRGTTTGLTDDLLRRWWRGADRLYGISVFHGGNIERDSSGDSKGAIFNKDALYLAIANDAEATEQRDESLRAVERGIFQEWGEGERADPHGVAVYSDSTSTL